MKKKKIYLIFIILSLVFGIMFSILIPLYQVPDEETHINSIYSFLGEEKNFLSETEYYGDTSRITNNYQEKVNLEKYFDFSKKINVLEEVKFVDFHIVRYLPQTIGIIISEIFNFPIVVSITLSEILAVLFYTTICLIALKKMPIKKEILMMIMLLPMSVQQMGSFSYDMILNAFSFLFIAYILHLKLEKEKIKNIDLIKLIMMIGIIAIVKIPYILLGLLIFTLPREKIFFLSKFKKKKINWLLFMLITLLFGIVFYKYLITISYVKVILAFVLNPVGGVKLILRTILHSIKFYITTLLGNFGWFDVPVFNGFYVFIIFSILFVSLLSNYDKKIFNQKEKLFILIFAIIFFFIIMISMFDWTLYYNGINTSNFTILDYTNYISSLKYILGVQGRYLIPIVPLLLILINFDINIKNKSKILMLYQYLYYVVIFVYMFIVILNRYWI